MSQQAVVKFQNLDKLIIHKRDRDKERERERERAVERRRNTT